MNKFLCGFATVAVLVGCASAGAAQVVNFEDNPINTGSDPLVSDGFSFTASSNGGSLYSWIDGEGSANGTNNLIYSVGPLIMTKVGGGTFSVSSLDAGLSWYVEGEGYTLDLYGTRSDLSLVHATVGLDYAFNTYTLSGFDNLVSLVFSNPTNGYIAIDNIDTGANGAVPEPASWALMLGGFGLVGGAMRSRRSATVSFG